MKQIAIGLAACLLASMSLPAFAATSDHEASRTFTKTVPAAGLTKVKLTVGVGQVKIGAGKTDAVRIRVSAEPGGHGHFIFDWTFSETSNGKTMLPADLHLVSRREGKALVICLASADARNGCTMDMSSAPAADSASGGMRIRFGDDEHHRGWKSDWTLVLPARLALALELGVGDADVNGLAGGLDAKIGVGDLEAKLPRGPVDANVGVGHIKASIAASDYGKVELSAGVGHVKFEVNGHDNETGHEKHFTAASQTVNGPGTTAYTLKAGVGHITLKLGVEGMHAAPTATVAAPQTMSVPAPASQTKPAVPTSSPQTTSAPATTTSERL